MQKMEFVPLVLEENINNGFKKVFAVGEENVLLVKEEDKYYAVENSCGHFGMPLESGTINHGVIRCPSHAMRFDLQNGEVINNLYDDCHAIKVYKIAVADGWVGVEV